MREYEINYILTTNKEMVEWLEDFQKWLESRNETIGGIIRPFIEERDGM